MNRERDNNGEEVEKNDKQMRKSINYKFSRTDFAKNDARYAYTIP
jgi:hypothetical protein